MRTYKKLILIFIVLTLNIFLNPLFADDPLPLFNEIIDANTGIKSLEAEIVQYMDTPEHSREVFKGKYRADDSGRFRIDYTAPSKQVVLNNGKTLYWYYPDDKILYIIGKSNNPPKEPKINPMEEFRHKEINNQFKIDYLGKHIYGFFNQAHRFTVKDIKSGLTFNIWADAGKKTLLTKIITNSGGIEILKETYGNYEKINDIYFPKRIDVYARTGGVIRNITEYSKIRLNYSLPESLFLMKFPDNVKKKYIDGG